LYPPPFPVGELEAAGAVDFEPLFMPAGAANAVAGAAAMTAAMRRLMSRLIVEGPFAVVAPCAAKL
jgi:hypothetical protein